MPPPRAAHGCARVEQRAPRPCSKNAGPPALTRHVRTRERANARTRERGHRQASAAPRTRHAHARRTHAGVRRRAWRCFNALALRPGGAPAAQGKGHTSDHAEILHAHGRPEERPVHARGAAPERLHTRAGIPRRIGARESRGPAELHARPPPGHASCSWTTPCARRTSGNLRRHASAQCEGHAQRAPGTRTCAGAGGSRESPAARGAPDGQGSGESLENAVVHRPAG